MNDALAELLHGAGLGNLNCHSLHGGRDTGIEKEPPEPRELSYPELRHIIWKEIGDLMESGDTFEEATRWIGERLHNPHFMDRVWDFIEERGFTEYPTHEQMEHFADDLWDEERREDERDYDLYEGEYAPPTPEGYYNFNEPYNEMPVGVTGEGIKEDKRVINAKSPWTLSHLPRKMLEGFKNDPNVPPSMKTKLEAALTMKGGLKGVSKQSGFIQRMMAEAKKKHGGEPYGPHPALPSYRNPTDPLHPGSTMKKGVPFNFRKLAKPSQHGQNQSAYGASPFIVEHFGHGRGGSKTREHIKNARNNYTQSVDVGADYLNSILHSLLDFYRKKGKSGRWLEKYEKELRSARQKHQGAVGDIMAQGEQVVSDDEDPDVEEEDPGVARGRGEDEEQKKARREAKERREARSAPKEVKAPTPKPKTPKPAKEEFKYAIPREITDVSPGDPDWKKEGVKKYLRGVEAAKPILGKVTVPSSRDDWKALSELSEKIVSRDDPEELYNKVLEWTERNKKYGHYPDALEALMDRIRSLAWKALPDKLRKGKYASQYEYLQTKPFGEIKPY